MTLLEFVKGISSMPEYVIRVGVPTSTSARDKDKTLNNAELLFILENGSYNLDGGVRIPPRPVIRYTLDWAKPQVKPTLKLALSKYIESDGNIDEYEKVLKGFANEIQNYAHNLILDRDPRFPPNAPSTIKAKGSDLPLFDTGILTRSILAILEKR